jgi:RNA polymerase sigma-70 factor, ECF subfamily
MSVRSSSLTAIGLDRLSPQMPPDDVAAVARARGGDEDAFRLLVERHSRSIYRLAYRMTGRPEDAEDVVQETFVRAYKQLGRFEARSNFGTWLYRIGFNCAVDYMRTRPFREVPDSLDALDQQPPQTHGPGADDLVYAGEIDGRVQRALLELSAQERMAFVMRHYHGCSIEEICGALDLKTNAAKHAVFRAVKKMRAALEPLVAVRAET